MIEYTETRIVFNWVRLIGTSRLLKQLSKMRNSLHFFCVAGKSRRPFDRQSISSSMLRKLPESRHVFGIFYFLFGWYLYVFIHNPYCINPKVVLYNHGLFWKSSNVPPWNEFCKNFRPVVPDLGRLVKSFTQVLNYISCRAFCPFLYLRPSLAPLTWPL